MKDNPLSSDHRNKVAAISDTSTKLSSSVVAAVVSTPNSTTTSTSNAKSCASVAETTTSVTNFDDDYNEWCDIGIGDLIIDLDADIEKNNVKNCNNNNILQTNGNAEQHTPASQNSSTVSMSSQKSSRVPVGAVEHQATVDKGLKMKIKRKSVGSKSETKHEIVKPEVVNKVSSDNQSSGSTTPNMPASVPPDAANAKSKHNSGKGRSSGHRDKKDKVKDKERNSVKNSDVNGSVSASQNSLIASSAVTTNPVVSAKSLSSASSSSLSSSTAATSSISSSSPVVTIASSPLPTASNSSSASMTVSSSAPVNNAVVSVGQAVSLPSTLPSPSVRIETPLSYLSFSLTPPSHSNAHPNSASSSNTTTNAVDGDHAKVPPAKKMKYPDKQMMDRSCSPIPPEVKESSVCTSVGTITEPECLGPCEPGTSVTLEGIVWHETEGGVLVVNVTWRGKTYVGTLLDCTKHDWAPPRFCDSPTSDLDTRTPKGRGKRGRGGSNGNSNDMSNFTETRASVHSKLRSNSKGRRGNNSNSSTVPVGSPAKGDNNNNANSGLKRKGKPTDLDISKESEAKAKRNRSASRSTPTSTTATPSNNSSNSSTCNSSSEPSAQPTSPVLIECPEPNCNKKYKHINGLKYHQSHAHHNGGLVPDSDKMQTEEQKEVCSDADESNDVDSVKCNEIEETEKMDETPSSKSATVSETDTLPTLASADSSKSAGTAKESSSDETNSAITKLPVSNACVSAGTESSVTCSFITMVTSASVVVPSQLITSTTPAYLTSSPISSIPANFANNADKTKNKVDKVEKSKIKPAVSARPIIPAPTPQVITLSANVNSQHLASVSSGVTSTLKPIQPKPTILGEPTTVNPALESLKKDKVKHKKKSRDKDKKVAPLQPNSTRADTKPVASETVSTAPESKSKNNVDGTAKEIVTGSAPLIANPPASSAVPLNCLDSSPLDIGALPVDSTANDNVQSPAYSDISDANDAPPAPPVLESEVNVKDKADEKSGKSISEQPANLQSGYGIYPYYGQPPYLIPSVPPPQANASGPPTSEVNEEKTVPVPKDNVPVDKKPLAAPITSSSASNMSEYQQKFPQQFYPYSYPGYSFGVEAYRRMQMMGPESNFKQRYDDQDQAVRHQQVDSMAKDLELKSKSERESIEKSSPLVLPGSESVVKGIAKPYQPPKPEQNALKEKQNENHQILKENIELKSHMEPGKPYDAKGPFMQRPDMRQYNYYQEKMMEEKKAAEAMRKKDENSDSSKMSKPLELSTVRRQSPMTRLPTSSPKTLATASIPSTKDSVSQLQSFVKDLSKKDKPLDNRKTDLKPHQEGQKPTMETTGPPIPNNYAYMPHPGSYLHPSPHYLSFDPTHSVYRGMNPMLMPPTAGYPGGPPTSAQYLPPQLRYDVPPSAAAHSQPPQMSPKRPQSMEHRQPTKALDLLQQHASQYYSSHKIQELQDRANKSPSTRAASPAVSSAVSSSSRDKLSAPDSTSGKTDNAATNDRSRSPPTQRHLHTHHHTHVGVGYPLYDPYGSKLIAKHQTEIG